MPSMQVSLDQAVLRMQALRGVHPVTKIGNARIRKIPSQKKQRRHRSKPDFTPAEEKERWALKSLGLTSWKDVENPISNPVQAGAGQTTRDRAQLRGKSRQMGGGREETCMAKTSGRGTEREGISGSKMGSEGQAAITYRTTESRELTGYSDGAVEKLA